ncbi:Complement C1q-like protein 4 [Mizuhopecten yessoensis]|uniref:Complement C1q-like protein 4 n=2 Tax=Mizuhopecten yessoensis TaxID=6573 RepID=A0A210QN68_MIZYE|nr:Complement C1q-like protein 4 [Mizuhopecten yessoensis]
MERTVKLLLVVFVLCLLEAECSPQITAGQSTTTLEQRVTALEREIGGLQTQNQLLVDCVTNMSSDQSDTVKCARKIVTAGISYGRNVMFSAQLTHTLSRVAVKQGIVFDSPVTNVGDCYSGHTGVFTCCKAGTYVFYWSIYTTGTHYVQTELMKNTSSIAINRSGDANNYSTGTMMVLLHLNFGDEVWIRVKSRNPATSNIYADKSSSFTGFLLQ